MNGQPEVTIPYWFWQGFGLIVLAIAGQIIYKWIDWKFFREVKTSISAEGRQTVVIDELFVKKFLDIYQKHVEYVSALSLNLQTQTDATRALLKDFTEHREADEDSHKIIREIHRRVVG